MATDHLTAAGMRTFSEGMLEVYNRHDVPAILERFTDDVLWTEPTLPEPVRGKPGVRASLEDTFHAFPDLEVLRTGFRVYPDEQDQSLVVTWTLTGTMTASMSGAPATGRSVRMSGANVARFRGGLVSEYTYHYDSLGMMQQLGLLPRSTGIGFKAIVMADVVAGRALKVLQRH